MSGSWFQSSERILDRIKALEGSEGKDRLEHVSSMRFMIGALHRSLLGWMQWVNNAGVMARLSAEELEEMSRNLSKFARSFVEYDLEVTQKVAEDRSEAEVRAERRLGEATSRLYI